MEFSTSTKGAATVLREAGQRGNLALDLDGLRRDEEDSKEELGTY
jgi:hypothetical protein